MTATDITARTTGTVTLGAAATATGALLADATGGTLSLITDRLVLRPGTDKLRGDIVQISPTTDRSVSLGVTYALPTPGDLRANTLRIGGATGAGLVLNLSVDGPVLLGATTLDIRASGAVLQGGSGRLTAGALTGRAQRVALAVGGNRVGRLGPFETTGAGTTGTLALTDDSPLLVTGTVQTTGDLALTVAHGAIALGNTTDAALLRTGTGRTITLTSDTLARGAAGGQVETPSGTLVVATPDARSISISSDPASGASHVLPTVAGAGVTVAIGARGGGVSNVVNVEVAGPVALAGHTLSVDAAGALVGAGTVTAERLAGTADRVDLTQAPQEIARLGPFTAVAGFLRLRTAGGLALDGPVRAVGASGGAQLFAGGGIVQNGVLDVGGNSLELAATGSVTQGAGAVITAAEVHSGAAGIGGALSLTGANRVDTLGSLIVNGGDIILNATNRGPAPGTVTVEGTVLAATGNVTLGIGRAGVTIPLALGTGIRPGRVIAGAGSTVSLQADVLAQGAAAGSLLQASGGTVGVRPFNTGRAVILGGPSATLTLPAVIADTLRIGDTTRATSITVSAPITVAGTLDLRTTGAVTDTPAGAVIARRLTGTASALSLGTIGNLAVRAIGSFATTGPTGQLALVNQVGLTVDGAVTAAGGASLATVSAPLTVAASGSVIATDTVSLTATGGGNLRQEGTVQGSTVTETSTLDGLIHSGGSQGSLSVTLSAGADIRQAGTVTGGGVTETAGADLIHSGTSSGSSVSIDAGHTMTQSGTVTGSGDVTETAVRDVIHGGDSTSGTRVALTATGGSLIQSGTVTAPMVSETAGIALLHSGASTGGSAVSLSGAFLTQSGNVTGGAVTETATGRDLTHTGSSVGTSVALTAARVFSQSRITGGPDGSIRATTGNVSITAGSGAPDSLLQFPNGIAGAPVIVADLGAVTLESGGGIILGGVTDARTTLTILARGGDIQETSGGLVRAAVLRGSVTRIAGRGGAAIFNTISADPARSNDVASLTRASAGPADAFRTDGRFVLFTRNAASTLTLPGGITTTADGVTIVAAGGDLTVSGTVTAPGPVALTADGVLTQAGAVRSAGGTVVETAGGTLSHSGSTVAAGDASLSGGGVIQSGTVTTGRFAILTARDGTITHAGSTTAAADATLAAAGGITLTGHVTATGTARLSAARGGISESGTGTIVAASLTGAAALDALLDTSSPAGSGNRVGVLSAFASGGQLAVANGGALRVTGPVTAGGALGLAVGGPLTVDAGTFVSAVGPATLSGTSLSLAGMVTAATLDLVASGDIDQGAGATGVLATGRLTGGAGGRALLAGVNRVPVAGRFSTGGDFTLATNVALTVADTVSVGGAARVIAFGGLAVSGGIVAAGGGESSLILRTDGAIREDASGRLASTDPGGRLTLAAGGPITLEGITSAPAVSLSAAGGSITASRGVLTAGSLDASAPAGAVILDGPAVAVGRVRQVSAAGRFDLVSGGDTSVSGPLTASAISIRAGGTVTLDGGTLTPTGGRDPTGSARRFPASPGLEANVFIAAAGVRQTGTTLVDPGRGAPDATFRIDLTTPDGIVSFADLVAPTTRLQLSLGSGTATGAIDVAALQIATSRLDPAGAASLTGFVAGRGGEAAAGVGSISPLANPRYRINGCPIGSVNCILLSPVLVPITNPIADVEAGTTLTRREDDDLVLPDVGEQDF